MKHPQTQERKRSARRWLWSGGCAAVALWAVETRVLPAAPPPQPQANPARPAVPPAGPSIFDDSPPPAGPPTDPKTIKVIPGPTTTPAQPDAPIPPPPAGGETAQQSFDRIYGPRIKKVNETSGKYDDINLARQILGDAMQLPPPSDLQKIMLRQVYDLGMHSHFGYDVAIAALQNLSRIYPDLSADSDDKILSIYEASSNLPHAKLSLIAQLYIAKIDSMAAERLKENDYDSAIKLYERSVRAEKAIGKDAAWHRQQLVRDLRDRGVVYRKLTAMRSTLEKTPDPTMAEAYVKLVLLDWDDPYVAADALPLVDEHLRSIATSATLALDKLSEPQAKEMADWYHTNWRAAIAGKAPSLGHAHKAYDRALALHAARDVVWLEMKSSLGDVIDEEQKLAREIAAKQKADERRDTTVITTKFNNTPRSSNGGGGGGRSGAP